MPVTKDQIVGSIAEVTYAVGQNVYATEKGEILDIISLSEHQHFIVLVGKKGNTLITLDAVYHIKLKLNNANPKVDARTELL